MTEASFKILPPLTPRLINGTEHLTFHPSGDMRRGMTIKQVQFNPTEKPPYKVGRLCAGPTPK